MPNGFLKVLHPLYRQRRAEWRANERRMRGGWDVLRELQRFDWETAAPADGLLGDLDWAMGTVRDVLPMGSGGELAPSLLTQPGAHYSARRNRAIYLNFPEFFATTVVGHLMRRAPSPEQDLSFGTLGMVHRTSKTQVPSSAELLYYNVDGVGNDGSQWDNWWAEVAKWAMATGHRWLMVEASTEAPLNRAEEIQGKRPFLINYSPLDVPNWHYEAGRLMFAVLVLPTREITVSAQGELEGNDATVRYRLLVRKGYTALGAAYAGGGWWEFKEDGTQIEGRSGTWERTNGEIPLWPHFYRRDKDLFSIPGTTELGSAAVSWMNLGSAADFDAWDAATSIQFLLGVDKDGFNLAVEKIKDGSRYVPVPIHPEIRIPPTVHDASTGAVTSGVFQERQVQIRNSVREISGMEASGNPESSGESKRMGFAEAKSPRLALVASEIEQSQNTAIHFLELRWGTAQVPQGSVRWPRDFEVVPLLDRLERVFDLEKLTGYKSPLVGAKGMTAAVQDAGLVTDSAELAKVKTQYEASAEQTIVRARQQDALMQQAMQDGTVDAGSDTPDPADSAVAASRIATQNPRPSLST